MSDSDEILLDSDGCEVRSDDSDSVGSLVDFITDEVESDPEWLPPTPRKSNRLRKKPVRFADEVFSEETESESEEEDSDDDTE